MNGVVKDDDVAPVVACSGVPPLEAAYQRKVPAVAPEDADSVTVPGLQAAPFVAVSVGEVAMVAVTGTRVVGPQAGDVVVSAT